MGYRSLDFEKDSLFLVTGGAGSIGSELCRQALNFGCKHLIIFDQHENGMFFLDQEFAKKYDTSRYTLVMGTVRERDKLIEVLEQHRPATFCWQPKVSTQATGWASRDSNMALIFASNSRWR